MRALVAQDPQRTDRRARLGNFLNSLGTCAYTLGDVDRARKHLEEALRVTRVLVEQLPQQSELREQLCLARGHLARLEVESGRRRRAMKLLEQNMATMAELVAAQPQRVDLRTSLAAYHWNYRPFGKSRRKKRAQLRTILEILRPVRAAAADDAELRRLWDGASRALGE